MENSFREDKNIFGLQVDEVSRSFLLETARWARFISIVGFIMLGLMLLGGLLGATGIMASSSYSGLGALGGVGVFMLYLVFAAIGFYPTLMLFKFSKSAKDALLSSNQDLMNDSFGSLKSFFKFYGIMMIIVLIFYAIVIFFAVFAALAMS